jgi:hypothetical protein
MINQEDTDVPDETPEDEAAMLELDKKAAAEAQAKLEADEAAARDAAAKAAERAAIPMRFSAPNLIGGRIAGFDIGDRLRIIDSLRNDGYYRVLRVENEWLVVAPDIRDEPSSRHAKILFITDLPATIGETPA